MTLALHHHPLSSFCWKALIALYENDTPFVPVIVNLGDATERAAFAALWPMAKFPVLEDRARGEVVGEASVIIAYLDAVAPGRTRFVPADPQAAWRAHMLDRVFDLYVQIPMQKATGDALRPADARDPHGAAEAEALLQRAYAYLETQIPETGWALGAGFSLVDCAALPASFYGDLVAPLTRDHPRLRAYLGRLIAHPPVARTLSEAAPYFAFFPGARTPDIARAGRWGDD